MEPVNPRKRNRRVDQDEKDSFFGCWSKTEGEQEATSSSRQQSQDDADLNIQPTTAYATRVPQPDTIIAAISHRRLDRIPASQALRTDMCLPCGGHAGDAPSSLLVQLPCRHTWCKTCLARVFLFALRNHVFGGGGRSPLRCCDDEAEIPLAVFESIVEDRAHPPSSSPRRWERTSSRRCSAANEAESRGNHVAAVTPCVETEQQDVFIDKSDLALFCVLREEFECLPRNRVYCSSITCGRFIPAARRNKGSGTCAHCERKTCLRCRRDWMEHALEDKGRCQASKRRMAVVKNEMKLFSLARKKGWKRCPRCGIFVSKDRLGCSSVVCQCGQSFHFF